MLILALMLVAAPPDVSKAYRIETPKVLKVKKGEAATARVEVVPRSDAHVSPDAPISLTVSAGPAVTCPKQKLWRAEFQYAELEDLLAAPGPAFLLVLDGVTDPQNLGALVRSAHALGAGGVVLPKDRAAGVTPAVFKAAAGALEHCPVARVTNLARAVEQMKEAGVWTVALAADADQELDAIDLKTPIAIVMGAEGSGVRPLVKKTCDHVARIPMAGKVGSLKGS